MDLKLTDTKKTNTFVELFQYLKLFTSAISIQLKNDNFYIQGMDQSQISVFEIHLLKEWFNEYNVNKNITLCMNNEIFGKILNTHDTNQSIKLFLNDENSDNIDISFASEHKDEFNKDFQMPLIDVDGEQLAIPETDYDLIFTINTKKFKSIIDELIVFGHLVEIKYEDEKLSLSTQTESGGSMKLYINIDDFEECEIDEDSFKSCTFNLRYIQMMCQYHKVSNFVKLYFSPNIPMQCKYLIDDENDKNFIRFYLAPKIED